MTAAFELGQPVHMTGTTVKIRCQDRTLYQPAPLPSTGRYGDDSRITDGIVVGKRTVAEGRTSYEEWGGHFTPDRHFEVWLIAFGLRRRPVMCTEDQLEAVQ